MFGLNESTTRSTLSQTERLPHLGRLKTKGAYSRLGVP